MDKVTSMFSKLKVRTSVEKKLDAFLAQKANPYHDAKGRFAKANEPVNHHFVSSFGKPKDKTMGYFSKEHFEDLSDVTKPGYKELSSHFEEHLSKLSTEELKTIVSYTGSSARLNRSLGEGTLSTNPSLKETVTNLDSALNNSSMPRNVTVARGLDGGLVLQQLGVTDFESAVGKMYHDKAYNSATIDLEDTGMARSFTAPYINGTVFHINVPKGAKAMYVAPVSKHAVEKELIIHRNSVYYIKGYDSAQNIVHVDLITSGINL